MRDKLQKGMLTLRKYWSRPQNGQNVAYKEIAGFSAGGMGVKSFASLMTYMSLSATCLLMGVVYGLTPNEIMILFLITNIIGLAKTPFVSMLQDRTKTAIGKFRPYMLWAGIPCVLSVIGLTWLVPYDGWLLPAGVTNKALTMTMIGIFINILTIAQQLLNNAYMGISQTISPLSSERTKIMGFSEFLGNLGPSIIQLVLPILGLCFAPTGDGAMRNPWTYRVFMPIFAILGFVLGLLVMYTSKERTVEAEYKKEKAEKIKFFTGLRLLARNKEFWLVTVSKFFDGFKGMLLMLLPWVCAYQIKNDSLQGIIQTIVSFACTPGIVLAPLLIKWLGSRGSGLLSHSLNVVAALIMLFTFEKGVIFFIIALFIYNLASGPQYIIQNTIMSDGFDAQQDRDNVRLEGFAQNFQLASVTLGTILSTLATTFILNYYEVGTVENGVADYSMLVDAEIRNKVYTAIIVLVIIASALATIPYIFVTLNKKRMAAIKESLEKKKFIEDNALENASEEEIAAQYAVYLTKKAEELEAERALSQLEKDQLEARQAAESAKIQTHIEELNAFAEQMRADGRSEKEIKKAVKARERQQKEEIKNARKQELDKVIADLRALRERRKAFCAEWVAEAKAEGKKRWLKVLAKEAFDDMIIAEQISAVSNEDKESENEAISQ